MDGGDSLDPKVDLNERINKNGKIYLQNLALTQTCSVDSKDNICFNPDVPLNAFKKDFFRDTVVTIDGVTYASGGAQTTEEEKEKVFKEVCDAFVRLITGDKDAEFAKASRAVKIQANVLMAYSMQGIEAVVMSSVGTAFDETSSSSRFSFTGTVREKKADDLEPLGA